MFAACNSAASAISAWTNSSNAGIAGWTIPTPPPAPSSRRSSHSGDRSSPGCAVDRGGWRRGENAALERQVRNVVVARLQAREWILRHVVLDEIVLDAGLVRLRKNSLPVDHVFVTDVGYVRQ